MKAVRFVGPDGEPRLGVLSHRFEQSVAHAASLRQGRHQRPVDESGQHIQRVWSSFSVVT